MDALLRDLHLEPAQGLEVLDAARLPDRPPTGDLPAIVLGLTGTTIDGARRALAGRYPADHAITLWRDGTIQTLPLHDLDKQDWADYSTSLYLPPLKRSEAGEASPRRWVATRWPAVSPTLSNILRAGVRPAVH